MISNKIKDELINNRRYLHKIPEQGFKEVMTSKYIQQKLKEYGFNIESTAKTGIIGYKKGTSINKAIAFRSDMDGLKINEETGLSFISKNKGMMHACGHDAHMSILLGLAKYISKLNKIDRDIVLIFQPAEEGPGGAEVIINEGIIERYNIEHIFGLHVSPELDQGKIGVTSGPMMAQVGEFDIDIIAKSGHGAIPHKAIDGIVASSQLINAYQSIVSRNINPIKTAVITIGKIEGGDRRNIIAENVRLEGTIRAFDKEIYSIIKNRMNEINNGIEKMMNINIDMEIRDEYPPVINDDGLFQTFKDILSEDEFINIEPMMISEDFSYYQKEISGLFFMLGCKNEEKGYTYPLHNCKFNFDEEILMHGLETYIKICKRLGVFN